VFFHFFARAGAGVLQPIASSGWIGVDLFFVLSGYLITSQLDELRGAPNYYRNFYVRRVLRLFPVFYFVFLAALVLTPLLKIHWRLGHLVILLQGANFALPADNSLGTLGPLNIFHLWSLSVEEQFYLLWPWLVGGNLTRRTLQRICLAGLIAAPLLRFSMLHEHVNPWWIYQSLPTRMDSLFAGALLALLPRPSLRTARMTGGAAVMAYGGLTWWGHSLFFLSRQIQGFGYSALALLFASMLVMSLYPVTVVSRVCSWSVLRFYGKYSYGIYLWHYLFSEQFGLLQGWVQRQIPISFIASVAGFGLILLCSTAIAVVSYSVIEKPFLRLKKRFEYRLSNFEAPITAEEKFSVV